MVDERICSKCHERPASGKHVWCRECRTAYQREWDEGREDRAERRGFAQGYVAGAEALRTALVDTAKSAPPAGMLRTAQVIAWILQQRAPAYEPKVTETESAPAAP